MKKYINKDKRELHPICICAILFFSAFFFTIITLDNSYEASKLYKAMAVATDYEGYHATSSDGEIRVVIDPGHGGNDPGKVSPSGILEKDINLAIALKLKEELESRGVEALMLREGDENLAAEGATNKKSSDMKKRVAIINEYKPSILISIHQNSFIDSKVRGPQVFYHSSSRKSEEFALTLQKGLNEIDPNNSRNIKMGSDYYILNKTICPGVIIECGFLSCPEEVSLLTSEAYQQKIASAIADAIQKSY